jgi:hypothetical protein
MSQLEKTSSSTSRTFFLCLSLFHEKNCKLVGTIHNRAKYHILELLSMISLSLMSLLSPPIPSLMSGIHKERKLFCFESQYVWEKIIIILVVVCLRKINYYTSCCTGRSSENICNSSGGAHEKGKTSWNSVRVSFSVLFWWKWVLPGLIPKCKGVFSTLQHIPSTIYFY